MRQLLLIPTAREAAHLLEAAPTPLAACPPFLGGELGEFSDTLWALCGVGPAAAALTATRLIAAWLPKRVILAGIAGSYRGAGPEPGSLVQASSEIWADLGFTTGEGQYQTIDDIHIPQLTWQDGQAGCRFDLTPLDVELPAVPMVTVASITNSQTRADALRDQFSAQVENMEGAGVALACKLANVPFAECRAISNWAGPRNPKTWQIKDPLNRLGNKLKPTLSGEK